MNNFDTAIAGDARLQARWDATREKVLADARHAGLGELDPEALKSLPGVKIAVFTDMGLPSDLLDEVKRLPQVQEALRKLEVQKQLEAGDSTLHAALERMSPSARMEYGRQIEAAKRAAAQAEKPAMSVEAEVALIAQLKRLDPQSRINAARAAGWVK